MGKRLQEDPGPIVKKKQKTVADVGANWPEYFHTLFKVYKAINTVLAFFWSRKALATTFHSVRGAVEDIIKQPLDLTKVGEMKALLPHMVRFSYVPENEVRIHASEPVEPPNGRCASPDFSISRGTALGSGSGSEHILLLEFQDNWTGQSTSSSGALVAPTRTPAATKKLIDKRNAAFCQAVEDLIVACAKDGDDPAQLIQNAGRSRIPLNSGLKDPRLGKEVILPIPSSEERPSIPGVLDEIQNQGWYFGQIAYQKSIPAKDVKTAELDPPLSDSISQALKNFRKITSLFIHQVKAIQALSQGRDVIVSTATASGKSVIYQVPLLRFLQENPNSTAIFVYPTKALAQDQRAALEQLLSACPGLEHIQVANYDGDTPKESRAEIRKTASVIFTNFDMIHASILPHEEQWRTFLRNLKLFVVDELHYYTGLFGVHVAYILRRLRRLCGAVGNRRVRFVSCSATIAEPLSHMQAIFGIDRDNIEAVTEDGAPSGPREFVMWETNRESSNPLKETAQLMAYLMTRGVRVIVFCKFRNTCELLTKLLRTHLSGIGRYDILERVKAYRGGYSPEDRREIEHSAFTGHLLGIIATNALELGVDIGALDAVLTVGFPHTVSSFRQQIGRAGRRNRDSLAILVLHDQPLDSYYKQHPEELFDRPTDELILDLESKIILEAHLHCAASEMPLSMDDSVYFGPLMKYICDARLKRDSDGRYWDTHPNFLPYPQQFISIRGVQEDKYVLVDVTKAGASTILEEIEYSRALFEIYEGAVYLHQGAPYLVTEVSHDSKIAKLVRSDVNWLTKPRDFTDVNASQTQRIREIKNSPHRAYYGRVDLRTLIFGFYKIRDNQILDRVDLETDPWDRETTGMWLDLPDAILELLQNDMAGIAAMPAAAIHAAQHAFLNHFSLGADARTECKAIEKEVYAQNDSPRKRPARLIFYDIVGQGGGVAAKAFDHVHEIFLKAHNKIESCPCEEDRGCMLCVQSSLCREFNKVTSKRGALIVLKGILGLEFDINDIPFWTPEDELAQSKGQHRTITPARPVLATGGLPVDIEPAGS
ncbi:DEAD/H helicase [Mycena floridula]|nr:DEAD/H helicase [Mycena floridula]